MVLGVCTTTLVNWAREGRLTPLFTLGGRRRYLRTEVERVLAENAGTPEAQRMIADAVRLYDQGWNVRQVAGKFDVSYGAMYRLLKKHTTLRPRSSPR